MNYTQLFNTIKTYCENEFPSTTFTGTDGVTTVTTVSTTQVNTFITQAEERIYNTFNLPSLRKNVTGVLTYGNKYLALPNDWLATYSIAVVDASGNYNYLINKDVNFIREAYPSQGMAYYGLPKYYAIFGPQYTYPNELACILGPTPDAGYTTELHYFFYPESITTVSSGQTWLGDNYDPALLYGSLVEAATFMKAEADIVALYGQKYKEAMDQLGRLSDGMERGDSYRDGMTKLDVSGRSS